MPFRPPGTTRFTGVDIISTASGEIVDIAGTDRQIICQGFTLNAENGDIDLSSQGNFLLSVNGIAQLNASGGLSVNGQQLKYDSISDTWKGH